MATHKQVFTLRLDETTYQKISHLARAERRSMTNYIEYVLLEHMTKMENKQCERIGREPRP